MSRNPTEIVQELLNDPTNPKVVNALVAEDATYVSLNYENADLKKIMPWAGTSQGPQAILDTYSQVNRYWENLGFEIKELFGSEGRVAVFGSFTYKSNTLGKAITSPFSIFAKVENEKITSMQFMEDTFGTASTFRSGGTWKFHANPAGQEVEV